MERRGEWNRNQYGIGTSVHRMEWGLAWNRDQYKTEGKIKWKREEWNRNQYGMENTATVVEVIEKVHLAS